MYCRAMKAEEGKGGKRREGEREKITLENTVIFQCVQGRFQA